VAFPQDNIINFDFPHSDGVLDYGWAMIPVRSSFTRPLEKTISVKRIVSLEMSPSKSVPAFEPKRSP